ncbi:MAG TPA: hypothetical protein VFA89_03875 [Terriglobales bacterium]|nr:hypothetical protein [Terriglobales bacterium]
MPDSVPNVPELTAQLVASGRQETEQLDHLKRDVLDAIDSGEYRVNRREVPFLSSQTPRSLPSWAAGQKVVKTLGPFRDALGKLVWFDFYRIKRQIKIARKTAADVFLSVPVDDILRAHRAQKSLKLSAGSVWFIANHIEPSAPAGAFTGLTIRSGEITFQGTLTITGDIVIVGESDVCQLKLDLAQPSVTADTHSSTGDDAKHMDLMLPEKVVANCSPGKAVLSTSFTMAVTLYGRKYSLKQAARPGRYDNTVNRIFIEFDNDQSSLEISSVESPLITPSRSAPLSESAWALSITQSIPIDQLGEAAGIGALAMVASAGLNIKWEDLEGLPVSFEKTYVLAEPGRIGITVPLAHSKHNRQKFDLWQFSTAADNTVLGQASLEYPKDIALLYNCLATSVEAVVMKEVLATLKVDRPVTADRQRLTLRSDQAEFINFKIKDIHYVYVEAKGILDRLLQQKNINALKPTAFALSNALIKTTQIDEFYLLGIVEGEHSITKGAFKVVAHIYNLLPSLPDPYVASFSLPSVTTARELYSRSPLSGIDLFALVTWDTPTSVKMLLGFSKSGAQAAVGVATTLLAPAMSAQNARAADSASPLRTTARSFVVRENPILSTRAEDAANEQALAKLFEGAFGARSSGNLYMLDVSTNVDLMGVGFAPYTHRERPKGIPSFPTDLPVSIEGIDLVSYAINTKIYTLPQIQWEPIRTVQNPDTSPYPFPSPATSPDTGSPTLIAIDNFKFIPIAPRPVIENFLSAYNDETQPGRAAALFNLPFGMTAVALWQKPKDTALPRALIDLNQPEFETTRVVGGIQLEIVATSPTIGDEFETPGFRGATIQTRNLIDLLTGTIPVDDEGKPLSVLGPVVDTIFNAEFKPSGANARVPVERMDISGYGATLFSNWLNPNAAIAATSQAKFDVLIGRTSHEIIQVKSILYPWGVPVVRTITIQRTSGAGVTRYDSGWKAQGPGKYDFSYFEMVGTSKVQVPNPFEFHPGLVGQIDHVTSIKDTGRMYRKPGAVPADDVVMQEVFFDADVLIEDVEIGANDGYVPSRRQCGFVQLAPYQKPLTPQQFYQLLSEEGPLGGPVDCVVNVGQSGQTMRVLRADVAGVDEMGGHYVFVTSCHGSIKLPREGSWSVVRRHENSNNIVGIDQDTGLSLIREGKRGTTPTAPYRFADAPDILHSSDPAADYGILHSTGTQKILYLRPTIQRNDTNIKSTLQPYFADSFAIVNSASIFPDPTTAFPLGASSGTILRIITAGQLQLTSGGSYTTPAGYTRDIVHSGNSRLYVDYSDAAGTGDPCEINYAFDSTAAVPWTATSKNHSLVVDLGGFNSIVSVSTGFDAAYGQKASMPKPKTTFGSILKPIVDMLSFLGGQDIGQAFAVSMSNLNTTSWQPKLQGILEVEIEFKIPPGELEVKIAHSGLDGKPPIPNEPEAEPLPTFKLECTIALKAYFNMSPQSLTVTHSDGSPATTEELAEATADMITSGAQLEIEGELHILCFTITPGVAGVYFVGILGLELGIDSQEGKSFGFKVAVGLELAAQWPVVGEVSVMMAIGLEMEWSDTGSGIFALMIFKGEAELLGGIIVIGISIEAKGGQESETNASGDKETYAICEVEFAVEVSLAFVIHFEFDETWQEKRLTS